MRLERTPPIVGTGIVPVAASAFLAMATIGACGDVPPPSDSPAPPPPPPATAATPTPPSRDTPHWLADGIGRAIEDALGDTREAAVALHGRPDSIARETTPNRHVRGQIDTLVTYRYGRFEIEYYVVSANGRELVSYARIVEPGIIGDIGFDVGATLESVTAFLGPPGETLGGEVRYEDEYATLRLGVVDDRIAWIHLTPYLD